MRILIAEDDYASRLFLMELLAPYGKCDLTIDGIDTLDAFLTALDEGQPYDLICLDVMMPRVDGLKVLRTIRSIESQRGIEGSRRVRAIITTALSDAYIDIDKSCDAYLPKPIDTGLLIRRIKDFGLIKE